MYYLYISTKFIFFCFTFFIVFVYNKEISNIKPYSNNKRNIKDVLFINGCETKIAPHPYRYRVLHQMEQLNAGFLESDEYFYLNFEPNIISDYRVIIFFRCPLTKEVREAIKIAKRFNKKVLFDIDDLVIDTKYTDIMPYIKTLSPKEKAIYDDGVIRMGKTLRLCDGAITTTEDLAKELKKYVRNVFINRNVASEEMWQLSKNILIKKNNIKGNNPIIIGYFSGSMTHDQDIKMIKPALYKVLQEFKNVQILLLGEFSNQNFLKEFSNQILYKKILDWKELPEIISHVDINIAPIENNIFNAAKSENKWVEAALVKVPTIASNFGAFKHAIQHNKTGLLCSNINDWYSSLKLLIENENIRKKIGENAYNVCKKKYNTIYSGIKLAKYINSISNKHIGFFLPSLQVFGGIYVILKHACFLQDEGWDVDFIFSNIEINRFEFQGHNFNVISLHNSIMTSHYDIIVASFFTTFISILNYYRTKKRLYLVQNYETDNYPYGNYFRSIVEKTYSSPFRVEYITISKWCRKWLWKKYKKKSKYSPNGIEFNSFIPHRRKLNNKKIRVLIDGGNFSLYKNVDESFKIIEKLDKKKFEVWYLSNNEKPKSWYKIDKFLKEIPIENVSLIYNECDILIKSSRIESFNYPLLEMMATGGFCISVPNENNIEYLKDGENCLLYNLGDINSGVNCFQRLINDKKLQKTLYKNGIATAKKYDWKNLKNQIISLYDP